MTAFHWPETELEWVEALDTAIFGLNWHAGRLAGVVKGGPAVNVERCELLIEQARERGIRVPELREVLRRHGITPLGQRRDVRGTVLEELGRQERGENLIGEDDDVVQL